MARIASRFAALFVAAFIILPAHVSAQQAFELKDLSEAPAIKSSSQAQSVIARSYPAHLQNAGIGGSVQVRFVVGPDGSVDSGSIEILAASSQALGEAAMEAVSKIEFTPGKKDGAAVPSYVVMPIRYAAR